MALKPGDPELGPEDSRGGKKAEKVFRVKVFTRKARAKLNFIPTTAARVLTASGPTRFSFKPNSSQTICTQAKKRASWNE